MEKYVNFLRGYYHGNPEDSSDEGKDSFEYKAGKVCNMADAVLSWGGLIAILIVTFKCLKKILKK